ncbi:hypothetical protein HAX54_053353 [Datura stramonium]|uniref:Uncharacterized protein n=1 Tax=Datura stramonium TaxID=4076 RepID=A0ABS8WRU6_DATST|nr:hypothetical protein [Datura stramonium]
MSGVLLVNRQSCPAKRQLKRRSRPKATRHTKNPRFTDESPIWYRLRVYLPSLLPSAGGLSALCGSPPVREKHLKAQKPSRCNALPSICASMGSRSSITPEKINSIYWAEPIQPSPEFKMKVEDKEN